MSALPILLTRPRQDIGLWMDHLDLVGVMMCGLCRICSLIVETRIVQHQMFYGNFVFCEVERLSNKQSLQISRGNKQSLNEIQVQEVSIFSRRKLLRKKKEVSLLLLFSLFHLQ